MEEDLRNAYEASRSLSLMTSAVPLTGPGVGGSIRTPYPVKHLPNQFISCNCYTLWFAVRSPQTALQRSGTLSTAPQPKQTASGGAAWRSMAQRVAGWVGKSGTWGNGTDFSRLPDQTVALRSASAPCAPSLLPSGLALWDSRLAPESGPGPMPPCRHRTLRPDHWPTAGLSAEWERDEKPV